MTWKKLVGVLVLVAVCVFGFLRYSANEEIKHFAVLHGLNPDYVRAVLKEENITLDELKEMKAKSTGGQKTIEDLGGG